MYEVLFKILRNQLWSQGPSPTCPSEGDRQDKVTLADKLQWQIQTFR